MLFVALRIPSFSLTNDIVVSLLCGYIKSYQSSMLLSEHVWCVLHPAVILSVWH